MESRVELSKIPAPPAGWERSAAGRVRGAILQLFVIAAILTYSHATCCAVYVPFDEKCMQEENNVCGDSKDILLCFEEKWTAFSKECQEKTFESAGDMLCSDELSKFCSSQWKNYRGVGKRFTPAELMDCLSGHHEAIEPLCQSVYAFLKSLRSRTTTEADFQTFQALFPSVQLKNYSLPDQYQLGKNGRRITGSARKVLPNMLDSFQRMDALGSLQLNEHDGYLVAPAKGGEIVLYLFDPKSHKLVDHQVVGLTGECDVGWVGLTKFVDLNGDGKLDLLSLVAMGCDEGMFDCSNSEVRVRLWNQNKFVDTAFPGAAALRLKYFGAACKKLENAALGDRD